MFSLQKPDFESFKAHNQLSYRETLIKWIQKTKETSQIQKTQDTGEKFAGPI